LSVVFFLLCDCDFICLAAEILRCVRCLPWTELNWSMLNWC